MEQKVVLITGASQGIGAAAARRFAAGGCRVVVNYHRSRERAEALAAEIGGWAVQADVADPVQVAGMVDNVLDKFCQLDILICNAGIAQQKLFGDLTDEDWRRIFAVNVDGPFYACQAVLPRMEEARAASDAMEVKVGKADWPMPTYSDILYYINADVVQKGIDALKVGAVTVSLGIARSVSKGIVYS